MTRQRFLATLIGLLLSGAVFASTPSEVVAWSGSVAYSYDGSGNIRQIGRDRFAYDVTSRLIQAEVNGIRRDYGYDAFGNRIDCTQARGTAEQSDCQQGRTISPANNRIVGVPHDAAGNVQSLNQHLYAYDAVNMVTRDTAGVQSREFIYTADDERIATHETPTGSWHWTARDPSGKVLREFTSTDGGSWQWVRDYVYRDDKLVASRHPAGGFVETYHYHLDHLGTPRRITNALDATVGFHDYHAFGPEVPGGANEPSLTPLKYTGHERDRWLGEGDDTLDYMHARYYSPGMGRFLSVDPGGYFPERPQSWNRYAYAENNAINRGDPDGRCTQEAGKPPCSDMEVVVTAKAPRFMEELDFVMSLAWTTPEGRGEVAPHEPDGFVYAVLPVGVGGIGPTIHKNSLQYVGESHVYRINGPDGRPHKIGESSQGTRKSDGQSIRAERQVRRLQRETGETYSSEIVKTTPGKQASRWYETGLIRRFRRLFGSEQLPGNKGDR
jgi:RHS repeat-associated protein